MRRSGIKYRPGTTPSAALVSPLLMQKPRLFGRLLLLFTLVPIVELTLLVWLGQQVGFWPTVGLITGTALLGSFLAHREGLAALGRFRSRLARGGMPGTELTDGLIILVAGALLLTPGVLTDIVGFLGLFPPTRALIRRAIAKRFAPTLAPTPPPTAPGGAGRDRRSVRGCERRGREHARQAARRVHATAVRVGRSVSGRGPA